MRLGRHDAGLADLHAAIAEAERLSFIGAELRARNNLAWLVVSDDPHATLAAARGGIELAMRMGVGDMVLQFAGVACAVAVDTGAWDWALGVMDEMREQSQAMSHRIEFGVTEATLRALRGEPRPEAVLDALEPLDPDTDPQILAAIDMARAWIAFVDGRLDESRRLAEAAATRALGAEQHAGYVLAGRAGLWLGDAEAVSSALASIGTLNQRGRAVEAAERTLQAGVAALADDPEARDLYDESVAAWRSLRLPWHLALCLHERDRYLPELAGNGTAEVQVLLEELGAAGLQRALRPLTPR
jgi:hypothetical protein